MENPSVPAPQANQADPAKPADPTLAAQQEKTDQVPQAPAPVTATAKAESDREIQGLVGRLIKERNSLRTENKLVSEKVMTRIDTIEEILKALVPAIASNAAPGTNVNLSEIVASISSEGASRTKTVDQELSQQQLLDQAEQAADNAFSIVKAILTPAGVDPNNLADPDVQLLKGIFDETFTSGSVDYTKMIQLSLRIADQRRTAGGQASTPNQNVNAKTTTVGDIEAQLKAAREEGHKQAMEDIKKLSGVRHDLPSSPGTGALLTDDNERRKQAIAKAREQQ